MGVVNSQGPTPVDLSIPAPVNPQELRRRIDAGEWVIDLRNRTAFAAGHLEGTLSFELSTSFVTYLGWLYQWGAPLTLIGDDLDQIANARRELVRIGVDNVTGSAVGDPSHVAAGAPLRSYRVGDFGALSRAMRSDDVTVLDVRQRAEHAGSHLEGAINIPLHELPGRINEVPAGEVWVHCGSGYRASIAASMLDRDGRTVVLVNDTFSHARASELTALSAK
jgi:rhodanese-related sulfurtransferase